jgi:hypothetical protein
MEQKTETFLYAIEGTETREEAVRKIRDCLSDEELIRLEKLDPEPDPRDSLYEALLHLLDSEDMRYLCFLKKEGSIYAFRWHLFGLEVDSPSRNKSKTCQEAYKRGKVREKLIVLNIISRNKSLDDTVGDRVELTELGKSVLAYRERIPRIAKAGG